MIIQFKNYDGCFAMIMPAAFWLFWPKMWHRKQKLHAGFCQTRWQKGRERYL